MKKRHACFRFIYHVILTACFTISPIYAQRTDLPQGTVPLTLKSPCIAPENANKSEPAPFWCAVNASIWTHEKECTTSVTETIIIPWSLGYIDRFIPHQTDQKIISVKTFVGVPAPNDASLILEPPATPVGSVPTRFESDSNTKVTLTLPRSTTPIAFKIQYIVIPGVVQFTSCGPESRRRAGKEYGPLQRVTTFPPLETPPSVSSDYDNDESLPSAEPPMNHFYMIVRWAMGGFSVEQVDDISLVFSMTNSRKAQVIDSAMYMEESTFDMGTVTEQNESVTTVSGNATLTEPAHIIAFVRFLVMTRSGYSPCIMNRDCFAEQALLKEGEPPKPSLGLIVLGLVGGCVILLIAIGVFFWVRKLQRGDDESEESSGGETALPQSLHHFAYDTGDDGSSNLWRALTPRNAENQ